MARSAASIQAEIDILETWLQSEDSLRSNISADGVSAGNNSRAELRKQLDELYMQLGRASGSAPMFVRGRVAGLGRGE